MIVVDINDNHKKKNETNGYNDSLLLMMMI